MELSFGCVSNLFYGGSEKMIGTFKSSDSWSLFRQKKPIHIPPIFFPTTFRKSEMELVAASERALCRRLCFHLFNLGEIKLRDEVIS